MNSQNQKIFIIGGTGFVGRVVLKELIRQNFNVKIFIRKNSEYKIRDICFYADSKNINMELIDGDINDIDRLSDIIKDCHAVINLLGIIRENKRKNITYKNIHINAVSNIVAACTKSGVTRFIHISALGSREDINMPYFYSKYIGEKIVKEKGLEWTIFKPSIIFGEEDKFINMLDKLIFPFIPFIIPGSGKSKMQPVSVKDVASAIVSSIKRQDCINKIIEAGGTEIFSFKDIIKLIAESKGINLPILINLPLFLIQPFVKLFEMCQVFPFTSEQIKMLQEDNICSNNEFSRIFDWKMTNLKEYLINK